MYTCGRGFAAFCFAGRRLEAAGLVLRVMVAVPLHGRGLCQAFGLGWFGLARVKGRHLITFA